MDNPVWKDPKYFNISTNLFGSAIIDSTVYSKSDLKNHNSSSDCWISINSGVYDLSRYKNDVIKNIREKGGNIDDLKLGVKCGETYTDINPSSIFRFQPYINSEDNKASTLNRIHLDYKIGTLKNYYKELYLYILLRIVFICLFIWLTIKRKNKIYIIPIIFLVFYYGRIIYINYENRQRITENIQKNLSNLN